MNPNVDILKRHRPFMRVEPSEAMPTLRKVSHEERMAMAQEISTDLVAKYKEAVLAVCVYGSTAKQLERPYSDLEIFCVLSDDLEVSDVKYLVNGLLVDISYSQETKLLMTARKVNLEWPIAADQYRNRIVLFERREWLRKLDEAVAENEKLDFTDAIRTAALAMTESWAAVRNANFNRDSIDLRSAAYRMAMDAANLVLLFNKKYVLTTSWFWRQAFECPRQPKDFPTLIKTAAGFVNSTTTGLVDAAERLWRETIRLVLAQGISIESAELTI